jgi:8-oxo-dGTP pyrophosphatase MutT (NUDIX family)
VLLLERASHAGFWQSVTGSQEGSETLIETARREAAEETGIAAPPEALVDWRITHTFPLRARRHARHRARFFARTAVAAAHPPRSRRASGLGVATLARRGREVFFLDQPRRHPHAAGEARPLIPFSNHS